MPEHIISERRHIADDLVAAIERLHGLDRALVDGRISSTERDRIRSGAVLPLRSGAARSLVVAIQVADRVGNRAMLFVTRLRLVPNTSRKILFSLTLTSLGEGDDFLEGSGPG